MTYEESMISALDDIGKYFRRLYHEEADPETYAKYYDMMSIISQASNLIEELMEEQEPRVLTREELKQFEGSPCWFESSGTYKDKNGFWIIPVMFRTFSAGIIMSYTSVLDGLADYGELGLSEYNKAWRCWSVKPTKKQREVIPWDI